MRLKASELWVELAPNSLPARQLRGVLLLRGDRFDAALEQFKAAVQIADALQEDGLLLSAGTLNGEDDQDKTLRLMQALVQAYADRASAHYALGIMSVAQKRYPEAIDALKAAIALRPAWALPRVLLSRALVASGEPVQGLQLLQRSVADYPKDATLRMSYARLLVTQQDFPAALEQFRVLYRQEPENVEVQYAYAMLASQQEAWKQAREVWQLLRARPKYADEATYFLAQVEEFDGNSTLAQGLYRSTGGEFRVDAVIRGTALRAADGDLDGAREEIALARITQPDRAVDLYIAETQLMQKGGVSPEKILAVYATALNAYPDSIDLRYNRGLYFSNIGRYVEMEEDFQAVLAVDADHAESLNALG